MENFKFNNEIRLKDDTYLLFADFDTFFPSYQFPIEVKDNVLFLNNKRVKKIEEGTKDEEELLFFKENIKLFLFNLEKVHPNSYLKWLRGRSLIEDQEFQQEFKEIRFRQRHIDAYLSYVLTK